MRLKACCALPVILQGIEYRGNQHNARIALPISFVQYDDLVSPGREGDLLLRKHLDLIAHDVNATVEDK